jgi:hypothetical protein
VYASYSKHLSALTRPSRPRSNVKGLRQVWLEVVPPRKGWYLSAIKSWRIPARMQSTVPYASSMGAHTTPITRESAVSMRRPVLQRKPSQGRVRSTTRTTEMCHGSITLATHCVFEDCNALKIKQEAQASEQKVQAQLQQWQQRLRLILKWWVQ